MILVKPKSKKKESSKIVVVKEFKYTHNNDHSEEDLESWMKKETSRISNQELTKRSSKKVDPRNVRN